MYIYIYIYHVLHKCMYIYMHILHNANCLLPVDYCVLPIAKPKVITTVLLNVEPPSGFPFVIILHWQAPGRNPFLDPWLLQQRGHWAWVITRQPNGTLSCLWMRTSKDSTPGSFLDNLWMVEHMSEPTLTGIGNYHWVSHLVAHTEPGGSGSVVAVQMKQPHSQG